MRLASAARKTGAARRRLHHFDAGRRVLPPVLNERLETLIGRPILVSASDRQPARS